MRVHLTEQALTLVRMGLLGLSQDEAYIKEIIYDWLATKGYKPGLRDPDKVAEIEDALKPFGEIGPAIQDIQREAKALFERLMSPKHEPGRHQSTKLWHKRARRKRMKEVLREFDKALTELYEIRGKSETPKTEDLDKIIQ